MTAYVTWWDILVLPLSSADITTAAVAVAIAFSVIFLVVALPVVIIMFILFKMGRLKCYPEKYIKPFPQSKDTVSPTFTASRPSDLQLKESTLDNIESGTPSTSTLKPLLGSAEDSNRNSMETPDSDCHPDACVKENKATYIVEAPSPRGTSCTPDSPYCIGATDNDGEDLFSGGLGPIVAKV